jgi:predicted nucleic acid-binding protein
VRAVVDANVVLALALPLPYSRQSANVVGRLRETGCDVYAPALLEYEMVSALRRAVSMGRMDQAAADGTLERLLQLGVMLISPAHSLDGLALLWSERLEHSKAYDAQYLALAEQMHCPLYTADLRLAAAARRLGANWVRLVGEEVHA